MGLNEKHQIKCLEKTVSDLMKKNKELEEKIKQLEKEKKVLEEWDDLNNKVIEDYQQQNMDSFGELVDKLDNVYDSLENMEWNNITCKKINNILDILGYIREELVSKL